MRATDSKSCGYTIDYSYTSSAPGMYKYLTYTLRISNSDFATSTGPYTVSMSATADS